jgi:hypothetical protein
VSAYDVGPARWHVMKRGGSGNPAQQVPAAEIERIVLDQVRILLQTPEVIVQTWRAARQQRHDGSSIQARLTISNVFIRRVRWAMAAARISGDART